MDLLKSRRVPYLSFAFALLPVLLMDRMITFSPVATRTHPSAHGSPVQIVYRSLALDSQVIYAQCKCKTGSINELFNLASLYSIQAGE